MTKTGDLHVEVQETLRRIIVTMPRTSYDATFGLIEHGLCLISGFGPNDRRAPIASHEFAVMARTAAVEKARELGWPTEGVRRTRAWRPTQAKR